MAADFNIVHQEQFVMLHKVKLKLPKDIRRKEDVWIKLKI